MWKEFGRLFTDNSCPACGSDLLADEREVCWGCLSQMEETGFHANPDQNEAFLRFAGKVPVTGAATLFYYDKGGRLQILLEHLKYKDSPRLGEFLGELYGHRLKDSALLEGVEALLPVPLHVRKLLMRGYNQAEKLALGVSKVTGIPVAKNLLRRTRFTTSQTRKGRRDRWLNVSGAFELLAPPPSGILLIDDVLTTGATLEACIQTLLSATEPPKVVRVAGVALARK